MDLWVWGLWVLGFSAKLLYRLLGQARSALQKAEFAPLNHTFLLLGCLAGGSTLLSAHQTRLIKCFAFGR